MSYTPLLRRIREDKTNYRKRKALLIGKHNFAAVRVSDQNVQVQVLRPAKKGDEVLVSTHSKELLKYGWNGSRKSIPACYLTGLLAGTKALVKNVKKCVLYSGNRIYSPRIAACVKGLLDAGMDIPVEKETLPSDDMLNGKHIADYAKDLKQNDNQLYTSRFSALVKKGFVPENYADNVAKAKSFILNKQVTKAETVVKTEAPRKEEPKAQEPKAQEPKAQEPKAQEPKAQEPKAQEPKAQEPKARKSAEKKAPKKKESKKGGKN